MKGCEAMIAIIDYGAGNLSSVQKALNSLGQDTVITADRDVLMNAQGVVLPGVGAFDQAIVSLKNKGLDEVIRTIVQNKTPFLGICLGMQLLFDYSEEGENNPKGLGIFQGTVKKIPKTKGIKIPHMGWNKVEFSNGQENQYYYFVHSFYVNASDKSIVTGALNYGTKLDVMIEKENVIATQFHPEKSGRSGLLILKKFANMIERMDGI